MTSFFARAYSQGQRFEAAEAFFAAAEAGTLRAHKKDWLPPALLARDLVKARRLGRWAIETPEGLMPRLTCTVGRDRKFVGLFWLKSARVDKVRVRIAGRVEPRTDGPSTRPAASQAASRALKGALESSPGPARAGEARKLLAELK
jgi:hypothetical protein